MKEYIQNAIFYTIVLNLFCKILRKQAKQHSTEFILKILMSSYRKFTRECFSQNRI